MNDRQTDALNLLMTIIKTQPSMFQIKSLCTNTGMDLADFCAGFIQRYSENQDQLEKGQYPQLQP